MVQRGARLFELQTHTHKRGKHTTIELPDGTLIYENFLFSDPVVQRYGLVYDITDFSATLSLLGTQERTALERAFRGRMVLFLLDGCDRLTQAVDALIRGGEAAASTEAYERLPETSRKALITFLRHL